MIHQFIVESLEKYKTTQTNLGSQIESAESSLLRLKEIYLQTTGAIEILQILKSRSEQLEKANEET